MSNGLVHNNLCRAHRNAVTLIAFLAIPKSECYLPVCEHRAAAIEYLVTTADREHEDSAEFCIFQRNLFHGSINHILQALQPDLETPEIVCYADGHFRRTIYGIGPYIADYPEQVLLACIVQGWCPR